MKLRNLVRRIKQRGKDAGAKLVRRHYLDVLYDSFARKDMSRRGFKRAYQRLMDPRKMAKEAEEIALYNKVRGSLRRP